MGNQFTELRKFLLLTARQQITRFGWGNLPDFIIIGAQRCGTTSLYNYLTQHPLILSALRKEVHYFDNNFHKGVSWYQAFFPLISLRNGYAKILSIDNSHLTGEATPYYLFHPLTPKRIAGLLPQVKLIVILRNPVDRAYSHFLHATRMGFETLSFKEAIAREAERVAAEEARLLDDQSYYSFEHQRFSYIHRGIYHRQGMV
jgi:hypothetical protein